MNVVPCFVLEVRCFAEQLALLAMKRIASAEEYMKLFFARNLDDVSQVETSTELYGRILKYKTREHQKTLHNNPKRKFVFVFGSDCLKSILGKSVVDILPLIGLTDEFASVFVPSHFFCISQLHEIENRARMALRDVRVPLLKSSETAPCNMGRVSRTHTSSLPGRPHVLRAILQNTAAKPL